MNKKKITKIVVIVSSIILVSLAAFGLTQAYYSSTVYSPVVNEYTTGILTIEAEGKTDNISLTDALPMDDEDALSEDPYIFTIRNIGNVDYQFDVQLLATSGNNTINPDYIKVRVDEEEPMTLSDLDDSKIMEDVVLKAGQTMDIKLWVWLSKNNPSTPNTEIGKTFDCEIVTQGKAIYTTSNNGEGITAAQYITNLYTNAGKSEVEVNGITYNLASSVNLMNDRHASMSTGIDDGDIRYYGASPNNYVWLGDYYTEDMIITRGISHYGSLEACIDEEGENSPYCQEDIEVHTGDKKLWRIVGVFNGKLKLVTDIPISTQGLSWDKSDQSVNNGFGVNEWSQADLMKLLNPGYENESVNNSLYWNKDEGTVYTNPINTTTEDVSFASTGLSEDEQDMIDNATWYTGAYANNNYSYVDVHYQAERENMGKICSSTYSGCTDEVIRTNEWNGKVGLISASDYGYGTNLNNCKATLNEYYQDECANNNWLMNGIWYWTVSPHARSNRANIVFTVSDYGSLSGGDANNAGFVRPAVYLKSGVTISGGNGSGSDPYVLSYSE